MLPNNEGNCHPELKIDCHSRESGNPWIPACAGMTEKYGDDGLGGVPAHYSGVVQIDLDAIKHNYRFIQKNLSNTQCGAVVKADAYGLGAVPISQALETVGCEDFFVATPVEGQELAAVLKPSARIYILNGLYPGAEAFYSQFNLIPVLNTLEQIAAWQKHARTLGKQLPAMVHFDTGIWRGGLTMDDVETLAKEPARLGHINIVHYLSHLACSEQPDHQRNSQQLERLKSCLDKLPKKSVSLANSHGMLLGEGYHFDLLRPGRLLYGLGARTPRTQGIRPGVSIFAKLLQVRDVVKGETIGYDATFLVERDMKVGTIGIGYADGFMRSLTNIGMVYVHGQPADVIGRVSMDLVTIDMTNVAPEHLKPGTWVEIVGDNFSADDLARLAGTNSREITSNLGIRYYRVYKG